MLSTSEHGIGWLSSEFSSGDFKPLSPKPTQSRKKQETEVEQVHDPTDNTNESSSVYTCPQDGCVKVFQRLSFVLAGITKSRKNLFCSLFCFLYLFLKFVYV